MMKKPETDISYSKLMIWVRTSDFVPLVIDYYDDKNPDRILKTLIQSNIKVIDDVPTGTKMVMYNRGDNTNTSIELTEIKYNIPLDDDLFTERGLKK